MKEFDPVVEEVNKADEVASVSPLVMKLDKCRIMSDTEVPSEDFLLSLPSQVPRSAERHTSPLR